MWSDANPFYYLACFFTLTADVLITIYPDVHALGFCRLFQGVALELSMGTGTAYLAEYLHPDINAAPALSPPSAPKSHLTYPVIPAASLAAGPPRCGFRRCRL